MKICGLHLFQGSLKWLTMPREVFHNPETQYRGIDPYILDKIFAQSTQDPFILIVTRVPSSLYIQSGLLHIDNPSELDIEDVKIYFEFNTRFYIVWRTNSIFNRS